MTVPSSIRAAVERAMDPSRRDRIREATPVGGGCINETLQVRTESGRTAFLKWNPSAPDDFFAAEERGLEALRSATSERGTQGLRVPEVLARGSVAAGEWLLLEMVEPGQAGASFWRTFGESLGRLHLRPPPPGPWEDNYIGPLPQENAPTLAWPSFWIDRRIEPQLRIAVDAGHFSVEQRHQFSTLLHRIEQILPAPPPEELAVLHGDFWSGNVFADREGRAVLVDPAVYVGDARVDLAMSELFGGFPPEFYAKYRQVMDPGTEYGEILRDAYQLYPLLVHVNLFGSSYVAGTLERTRRILAY